MEECNIFLYIRKSSEETNYSVVTQENSINNYLRILNLNPDKICHKLCLVGSAYNNQTTHEDILNFIKKRKISIFSFLTLVVYQEI